jgi:hypothetical protein
MVPPPLKTDPKYGCLPWWPENGDDWVHPDDVTTARSLIPSERIFRRDGTEGDYVLLQYGEIRIRVRRTMWQQVETEGLEIGDWVEVLTRGMQNTARTGTIREMLWDESVRRIGYKIFENGQPIEQLYRREDLQHIERRLDSGA